MHTGVQKLITRSIALSAAMLAIAGCDSHAPSQPVALVRAGSVANSVSNDAFFTDALSGPSSPELNVSSEFGYAGGGLARTSELGYPDRPENTTGFGGYLGAGDFTASLTVDLHANDIVYFGLGQANTNPSYFNEPTNAFLFRIHIWGGYTGIQVAASVLSSNPSFPLLDDQEIGQYTGKATFTITRVGDNLTFSIPSQGTSHTFSISQYAGAMGLNASNTVLFFGNTFSGTVFSDLIVKPIVSSGSPPVISSVAPSTASIWPPNGKMVPVTVAVNATGTPAPSCAISSVTSNEGAVRAGDQYQITGALSLSLRAERQGSGNGRVYTVAVTCTNASGSATSTTTVSVPHDQGK